MKKYLTDREKEERMNYLTIHKYKNEDERKELKELCDWYFKDTPVLTMSFSLTEEDLRVTMERDVELSAVAGAVKNQHHKKKTFNEETESFIRKKFDMPIPDESKEP